MVRFYSWVTEVFIGAVIVCVWIFNFHPWVLLEVWFASWSAGMWTWSVQVLPWRFVGWLWAWSTVISGVVKLRNFYVWMNCDVVNVVCHGEINGCNPYRWSVSIMSCSCGGCNYSNVVTLSSLYMNCDDSRLWCLQKWDCDLDLTSPIPPLHGGVCELDLA